MKVDAKAVGTWSSAAAAVGGIVYSVIKTIMWASALTVSISASSSDIATLKSDIASQKAACIASESQTRSMIQAGLHQTENALGDQAQALVALQTEVRIRHERGAGARVTMAVQATSMATSHALQAARLTSPAGIRTTF